MQTTGVALQNTTTITHIDKGMFEGAISEKPLLSAIGERYDILNKRGAIELAGVDHQLLRIVALEGVGHIRAPQELAGIEQRQTSTYWLTATLAQELTDGDAICSELLGLRHSPPLPHEEQQQQQRGYDIS